MHFLRLFGTALAGLGLASGISLDVNSPASIKSASSTIVYDMLKAWYNGNLSSTPTDAGLLPNPPYYWWEAGAMFGGLVNYAHYTGDISYNPTIANAIVSQASPTDDFMLIETLHAQLGNDDILFWALTAMNAAEYSFPVPKGTDKDIYFTLTRNVFNLMVSRWNTTTCDGGLKWQFLPANNGFYYKSTITNSAFFQIAARLGRMTGNQTYLDWAEKSYDWMTAVGYIDSKTYSVYDGAGDANGANCSSIDPSEWSYNIGSTIAGAAYMADATGDAKWTTRTQGFLSAIQNKFVTPYANATGIMYERCESAKCDTDQLSFKAYLAQSLGKAAVMVPAINDQVVSILKTSAQAAAKTCTGTSTSGAGNQFCGAKWYIGAWDGTSGVGQQMGAFETISTLLIGSASMPVKRGDINDGSGSGEGSSSSSTVSATSATMAIGSSSTTATITSTAIQASGSAGDGSETLVGFLATPGQSVPDCLCIPA